MSDVLKTMAQMSPVSSEHRTNLIVNTGINSASSPTDRKSVYSPVSRRRRDTDQISNSNTPGKTAINGHQSIDNGYQHLETITQATRMPSAFGITGTNEVIHLSLFSVSIFIYTKKANLHMYSNNLGIYMQCIEILS